MFKDDILLVEEYEVQDGDRLIKKDSSLIETEIKSNELEDVKLISDINEDMQELKKEDTEVKLNDNSNKDDELSTDYNLNDDVDKNNFQEKFNEIKVIVNNKEVVLKGKNEYVFVDVFDYIDFDLTISKGIINAKVNGEKSSYTAKIVEGDVIEVYWS